MASRQALDGVNSAENMDPHLIYSFWCNIMGPQAGTGDDFGDNETSGDLLISDETLWAPVMNIILNLLPSDIGFRFDGNLKPHCVRRRSSGDG